MPQQQVAETYSRCFPQIDRLNRCTQDDLQLEHKLVTHNRSIRVIMSLLGICIVDSWLLFAEARGAAPGLNQDGYYEDLA